jgi:hypothetical protein
MWVLASADLELLHISCCTSAAILLGIVALFEKIYDDEPILTIFSNIEEDVQ